MNTSLGATLSKYMMRIPGMTHVMSVWKGVPKPVRLWYLMLGLGITTVMITSTYALIVFGTIVSLNVTVPTALPESVSKTMIEDAVTKESVRAQAHERLLQNLPQFVDPSR